MQAITSILTSTFFGEILDILSNYINSMILFGFVFILLVCHIWIDFTINSINSFASSQQVIDLKILDKTNKKSSTNYIQKYLIDVLFI